MARTHRTGGGVLLELSRTARSVGGGSIRRQWTRIKHLGARLGGDDPSDDSGSDVLYDNAIYQVDYGVVPEIVRSRIGDKVTLCVVELPKNCPPGDLRGIVYRAANWRTREHWTLSDSAHDCGGA